MIVDAHSHLGWSEIFSAGITEELLLGTMSANGIDVTMVMPAAGSDPRTTHDAIAELAEREAGRVFGMASITPLIGEQAYVDESRRCVERARLQGVKLHPQAHATSPVLPVADVVFRTASELGVPVMVHTGTGAPFALPSLLIRRAREYPSLKIILAHARVRRLFRGSDHRRRGLREHLPRAVLVHCWRHRAGWCACSGRNASCSEAICRTTCRSS